MSKSRLLPVVIRAAAGAVAPKTYLYVPAGRRDVTGARNESTDRRKWNNHVAECLEGSADYTSEVKSQHSRVHRGAHSADARARIAHESVGTRSPAQRPRTQLQSAWPRLRAQQQQTSPRPSMWTRSRSARAENTEIWSPDSLAPASRRRVFLFC